MGAPEESSNKKMTKEQLNNLFTWLQVDESWLSVSQSEGRSTQELSEQVFPLLEQNQNLENHFRAIYHFVAHLRKDCGYSDRNIHQWWEQAKKRETAALNQSQLLRVASGSDSGPEHLGIRTHMPEEAKKGTPITEQASNFATNRMTNVYLALTIFATVCAAIALAVALKQTSVPTFFKDVAAPGVATAVGSTWNYIDVVRGFAEAFRQYQLGDRTWMATLTSSVQLMACTMAANIGVHAGMAASMASGLIGFSFAACMGIAALVEWNGYFSAKDKAEKLKKDMIKIGPKDLNYPRVSEEYLRQRAIAADHCRQARSWTTCFVGMLGVALAATLTVGIASTGVGAGVLLGISLVAVASALIRQWWVNRVNHQANVTGSLQEGENSLKAQIDSLPEALVIAGREVSLTNTHLVGGRINRLFRQSLSFKEYLYDLMVQDPDKARAVVRELTSDEPKLANLDKLLGKRRGMNTGIGQTRGQALLKALTPTPFPTESTESMGSEPG